jgi:hypothetical protein
LNAAAGLVLDLSAFDPRFLHQQNIAIVENNHVGSGIFNRRRKEQDNENPTQNEP